MICQLREAWELCSVLCAEKPRGLLHHDDLYGGKDAQGLKNVRLYQRHTCTWDTHMHLHSWPWHTSGTQMHTHVCAHTIYEAYTHSHSRAHMHTHDTQYLYGYTHSHMFAHTHMYVLTCPHCICTLPPLLCLTPTHPSAFIPKVTASGQQPWPPTWLQVTQAKPSWHLALFLLCLPLICHWIIM